MRILLMIMLAFFSCNSYALWMKTQDLMLKCSAAKNVIQTNTFTAESANEISTCSNYIKGCIDGELSALYHDELEIKNEARGKVADCIGEEMSTKSILELASVFIKYVDKNPQIMSYQACDSFFAAFYSTYNNSLEKCVIKLNKASDKK